MVEFIGILNADSRKSVSKFSWLRWFLVFEDLYNGEGSSQTNKTSKKTEFKLKTVSNFKARANFFNFLSVKLYYSTQKYDDSITRYFPFSKRQFPQKLNAVFTSCMWNFQEVFLIILSLFANLKLMSAFYS